MKESFCACFKCPFYASGQQYSKCDFPRHLKQGLQPRDAAKVRYAVEQCRCKGKLLLETYEGLATQEALS